MAPVRSGQKMSREYSFKVPPLQFPFSIISNSSTTGLRDYWESPWATYSRGRSRWRNQFLVEYLQRAGIDRSKKQVASHIQVLRNMWKGEPGQYLFHIFLESILTIILEYHLVAGGEELFPDSGILESVKAEELPDAHLFIDEHSPVSDRSGGSLSSRTSRSIFPSRSPTMGFKMEPSISPYQSSRILTADDDRRRVRSMSTSEIAYTEQRRLSPLASSWTPDMSVRSPTSQSCPNVPYTATYAELDLNRGYERHMLTADQLLPDLLLSDSPRLYNSSSLFSASVPVSCPPILTQLSLWAEGMQPAAVPVDALSSSAQPADLSASVVALRIKLHLPPIDAPYSPALHGFQGSITCNASHNPSVRCATTVFVRNQCVARENTYCSVMATDPSGHDGLDTITLLLPDSPLSQSRWLDPSEFFSTFSPAAPC